MAGLVEILQRTISQNPADQTAALEFLRNACESHYAEFVQELINVLVNVENPAFVRQAAGLQLKNTLASKELELSDVYHQRWIALPAAVRQTVKNAVLQTLGTEQRPSTAAQCVAAISCIELPVNGWPDVIDRLMANVTNAGSQEPLKESSLEALGYICQDMPPVVMESRSNAILTAIVHGMRADEPSAHVRLAAVNALLNSLEFTRSNFGNEQERNIIMEVTCQASQSADTQIKVVALQCLVKIMSLYYQYMERYMSAALFPITVEAMKSDVQEVALQGIEFWSNVCEEELNLSIELEEAEEQGTVPEQVSKHYARGALQFILPILTETLAKQDDHDDDDEWIPAKAAGVCIMFLAQCCGDAILDAIFPFINEHFINPNWHYREAAIMAFGSILEGPSKANLMTLVERAITPLIGTLSDAHAAVKDTSAWAIGRICDTCEGLVTKPEILQSLLPALSVALQDQPRVAANVCWAISSLVKAAYQMSLNASNTETFVLSSVFEAMVNELIKTTDRADASLHNLRIAAYEALMELIKNSPSDCYPVVQNTTVIILQKLETLLGVEDSIVSTTDRSQLRDLQSQLCATLQSVLSKIHKEDAPQISDAIMNGLLQIMRRCFVRDGGGVIEEALMAVTSLIYTLELGFDKYMESFKPYLFHALDCHDDSQVCITAVGVVTDLCRVFEAGVAPIMDEIVMKLLSIIADPKTKQTVKTHVLSCFGDVALAINSGFSRYLEQCLKWLGEAVEAAKVTNPDDIDQVDYVDNLRENCCSALSGIVQALSDTPDLLRPHANLMYALLVQVAEANPVPPDTVTANALALLGDLIHTLGDQFLVFTETPHFNALFERCHRSKSNKSKTVCTFLTRMIAQARRQVQASQA